MVDDTCSEGEEEGSDKHRRRREWRRHKGCRGDGEQVGDAKDVERRDAYSPAASFRHDDCWRRHLRDHQRVDRSRRRQYQTNGSDVYRGEVGATELTMGHILW